MTIWRPHQGIRVKAIGLLWRESRLLVADVYDDSGNLKGVRPLGGTVEFGETWRDALIREFQEELGVDVQIAKTPLVLENIYRHEGQLGHEVIFAADATLSNPSALPDTTITFAEENGIMCKAKWRALSELDTTNGPHLYPTGLKQRLIAV
ncbi:NUDIX domain protein [Ruegeria denitrificans]|uniref:NUDIX domain protein n=1 Tax=Ruegeria denitrificans TaxID=1715692 RepID=A0A0P1IB58_9RHOB|nr:NUDIX domain-containing protein [Ruegeria denitrificans]CUK02657.1 NUDIX domain protein [Ruegeria denitrificans]